MIPLLHSLHALAQQRNDGLHPELRKRLTHMDADKLNELNATASDLQRRRDLAEARHEREKARRTLLGKLMDMEREADQLKAWMARQELRLTPEAGSEVNRLLQWANDELAFLETMRDPGQLAAMLRQQNLFPDVDRLADPLGDPPPARPWGR